MPLSKLILSKFQWLCLSVFERANNPNEGGGGGGVLYQIVQKTFIGEGEGKKAPNFVAGEILSFFTRNNFVVTDRGETIT